jgi:hypothetical protein
MATHTLVVSGTTGLPADVAVIKTEVFDVDMGQWLLDKADLPKEDKRRLRLYMKERTLGNQRRVQYKLGKDCKGQFLGRWCVVGGQGLQGLPHEIRNALADKHYWDLDMENAQPTILRQFCERQGWTCPVLVHFVERRNELMEDAVQQTGMSLPAVKTTVLSMFFGAGRDSISVLTPFFVNELYPEIQRIMANVWKFCDKELKWLTGRKSVEQGKSKEGSALGYILQTEERKILMSVERALKQLANRDVDVYIHDGCLVRKREGETELPPALIRDVEVAVHTDTGYRIHLRTKPMPVAWERPDTNDLLPANIIVDDRYASQKLISLLGDRILAQGDKVWVFDDQSGIWSSQPVFLDRLMTQRYSEELTFRQEKEGREKIINYGGDLTHQEKLRKFLPRMLPNDEQFFKEHRASATRKLLFEDGIYDFETHSFSPNFNRDIIFHHAVPMKFPTERNEEDIEFVRRIFFRDPFQNPAVGDVQLHYLSRALAGTELAEKKPVVINIGDTSTAKGLLIRFLEYSLGSLTRTFQGDSLLQRDGAEATKALSWIDPIAHARIACASEISVNPDKPRPINGALLKNISGGDTLTIRRNHVDEYDISMEAVMFMFANDVPAFGGDDSSGAVRARLVVIPYHYQFVDESEMKLPHHKKRDTTLEHRLMTSRYAKAFIHLVLDTMKSWNGQTIPLPDECKETRNEVAPATDIREILQERYDITNNPEDRIAIEDIRDFLKRRGSPLGPNSLGRKLTQLGLNSIIVVEHRRRVFYRTGIRLAEL